MLDLENTFKSPAFRLSVTALSMTAALQLGVAQKAIAAPLPGEFSGAASALDLFVGVSTLASPTLHAAAVGCPCTGTNGVTKTATGASVTLGTSGSLVSADATTATVLASNTNTTAKSAESASVTKLSLLGGMITADAITASAQAGATPGTLATSDDGTTLTHLVIAGNSIDPAVPENTTIALPGLGSVTVKAVTSVSTAKHAAISVRGLLVTVSATNSFGLAVGSRIAVASAKAGYSRKEPVAYLAGYGAGADVTTQTSSGDDTVGSGSRVGLPGCSGTNGVTRTSTASALSIPGLASAATEQATAFGGPLGTAQVTKTTDTVSGLSMLGGLITAKTISAVAQVSRTGNISTASADGSGLTDLVVAGVPVPANTPANLRITLPGIGYVVVNEQASGAMHSRMAVTGLDVTVTQANLLGLPVGLHVALARAVAVARHF